MPLSTDGHQRWSAYEALSVTGAVMRVWHAKGTVGFFAAFYWLSGLLTFRLIRFALRLGRHAWRRGGLPFVEGGTASPQEVRVRQAEFLAGAVSLLSIVYWQSRLPTPAVAGLDWLSDLLVSVVTCGAALALALVVATTTARHGDRLSQVVAAKVPVTTAAKYALVMAPCLLLPRALAELWHGEAPETSYPQVPVTAAVLLVPVSYWIVFAVRASMVVSKNRFRADASSAEIASLTGMFVGCISLTVAIHGIARDGLAPDGGTPAATVVGLVAPVVLGLLSAAQYRHAP